MRGVRSLISVQHGRGRRRLIKRSRYISIAFLVRQLAICAVEASAVAFVVPDRLAAAKAETARFGVSLVRVHPAGLTRGQRERGEDEILPGVAGVQPPALQIDR